MKKRQQNIQKKAVFSLLAEYIYIHKLSGSLSYISKPESR